MLRLIERCLQMGLFQPSQLPRKARALEAWATMTYNDKVTIRIAAKGRQMSDRNPVQKQRVSRDIQGLVCLTGIEREDSEGQRLMRERAFRYVESGVALTATNQSTMGKESTTIICGKIHILEGGMLPTWQLQ